MTANEKTLIDNLRAAQNAQGDYKELKTCNFSTDISGGSSGSSGSSGGSAAKKEALSANGNELKHFIFVSRRIQYMQNYNCVICIIV